MADLTKSLTDVENGILGALETLDRLDEFLLPHPSPDNQGLGVNLNHLVGQLSAIRAASDGVDLPIPVEVVERFVDAAKSPDNFTAELHQRAQRMSDGVVEKQMGLGVLEVHIRERSETLLGGGAAPKALKPSVSAAGAGGKRPRNG